MDSRANMRAMLESARQSVRSRAANATGKAPAKKVVSIAASKHTHKKPTESAVKEVVEGLHFQKDTTSGAEDTADTANAPNAKDSQMQFVQHYYRLLSAFIEDKSKYQLELPNLSGLDRMVVHALAEKCNLSHESAGTRSDRVMHLKKDILFFQHPEAAQQVNLDEIIEKVSWKESKFHIRYVRSANPAQVAVGDIGSYADEDALQKIERFRRATDEYRYATDMGYTQQELLLAEAGGQGTAEGEEGYAASRNVEEILSRPDTSAPAITAGPTAAASSAASMSTQGTAAPTVSSTAARAMKVAAAAAASSAQAKAATTTVFDEVCRSCGTRVRLSGPPQGWKCSHLCVHCTKQTIWSLEEVKIQEQKPAAKEASSTKRNRDGTEGEADAKREKKRHGGAAVEEIDREDEGEAVEGDVSAQTLEEDDLANGDNAEEDDDGLTVEDIMEVAATNDFNAKDVNWLRDFASLAGAHPGRRVAFCIDFGDLPEMPIFARYSTAASSSAADEAASGWYVVVREVRALSLSVSDLLRELLNEAFTVPSTAKSTESTSVEEIQTEDAERRAMEHLGVAFPNLSVYGAECVAVSQLRPVVRGASVPRVSVNTEALRQLRQRYGERHFFATQSLQEAVARATDSASA